MAEQVGLADPGNVTQLRQLNRTTVAGGDAAGPWPGEIVTLERRREHQARIVEINQAELAAIDEQIANLKAIAAEKGWP